MRWRGAACQQPPGPPPRAANLLNTVIVDEWRSVDNNLLCSLNGRWFSRTLRLATRAGFLSVATKNKVANGDRSLLIFHVIRLRIRRVLCRTNIMRQPALCRLSAGVLEAALLWSASHSRLLRHPTDPALNELILRLFDEAWK